MPKIVYMHSRGSGTYRPLRSDTLWGMLCWLKSYLHDDAGREMDKLMDAYRNKAESPPFVISSAFPWHTKEGKRVHFLPTPFYPDTLLNEAIPEGTSVRKTKQILRKIKKGNERSAFISLDALLKGEDPRPRSRNIEQTRAMTHNLIDRRRLGTFTANGSGQLFHTQEQYLDWKGDKASISEEGLFFLVDGDITQLEPALRLATHWGLAGDRSTGKGLFSFEIKDLDWPPVQDANARLLLSLFRPDTANMGVFADAEQDALLNYRLIDRAGRTIHDRRVLRKNRFFFAEGSIFPKGMFINDHPGDLFEDGKHRFGHTIYRNGYAFFMDIKLPLP